MKKKYQELGGPMSPFQGRLSPLGENNQPSEYLRLQSFNVTFE